MIEMFKTKKEDFTNGIWFNCYQCIYKTIKDEKTLKIMQITTTTPISNTNNYLRFTNRSLMEVGFGTSARDILSHFQPQQSSHSKI
jgi:hypothetical protein